LNGTRHLCEDGLHQITARRTVWLLIDRAAVTASVKGWLDDWLKNRLEAPDFSPVAGSLAIAVGGEEIAAFKHVTTAFRPGDQADVISARFSQSMPGDTTCFKMPKFFWGFT